MLKEREPLDVQRLYITVREGQRHGKTRPL